MMQGHLEKPDGSGQSDQKCAKACYSVMPVCSEQMTMVSEMNDLPMTTASELKKTVCSEQLKSYGSEMNGLLKKMMICLHWYCGLQSGSRHLSVILHFWTAHQPEKLKMPIPSASQQRNF